jgi:hypothetical protein
VCPRSQAPSAASPGRLSGRRTPIAIDSMLLPNAYRTDRLRDCPPLRH